MVFVGKEAGEGEAYIGAVLLFLFELRLVGRIPVGQMVIKSLQSR